MIVIAGHWEIGYMAPIMEVYEWAFPLREFNIKDWAMCPVSGIRNPENQINLKEYENFDLIFEDYPDLDRVYVEPKTKHYNPETIWLHDFEHPENCIYIFGSAHKNPTIGKTRENDMVVTIKTEQDKGALWANQCMTLVLYDRMIKSWQ